MAYRKQPVPFGKYLLLDRINVGGMAEVWRGKTLSSMGGIERLVAVKRILPNIAEDEEFVSMFMDEARITVQLAHANIAQIYDFSFERIHNSYYIAMEYIPGKDLRAVFDRCRKLGKPAPVPMVCYTIGKACDGLDYAHRKKDSSGRDLNIVHRDVSPQNILISFDGDVKVIDFGVAKAAGKATRTQAGILKGKFGYMSPEQVRAQQVDRRADVFAAGICLYELLTGNRLFTGESDFSVLDKVRAAEISPPTVLNADVPEALSKIVLKALSRDLEVRYQYASELSEDLQRFLITSNSLFSRKDLAAYMRATFAEDVEKEVARLADYADVHAPPEEPTSDEIPVRRTTPTALPVRRMTPAPSPAMVPVPLERNGTGDSGEHVPFGDEPTNLLMETSDSRGPDTQRTSVLVSDTVSQPAAQPAVQEERSTDSVVAYQEETFATEPPAPSAVVEPPKPKRVLLPFVWPFPIPKLKSPKERALAAGGVFVLLLSLGLLFSGRSSEGVLCLDIAPALRGKAQVKINKEDLGQPTTWPLLRRMKPGSIAVSVRAPGYFPFEKTVEVKSRGTPRVTVVELLPMAAQAKVVVATNPPDAEIELDGQRVRAGGERELFMGEIPVGKEVLVEVVAPGFRSFSRSIRASSSQDAQVVKADLEREREEFLIRVTSRPSSALVLLHNQVMGRTPITFKSLGGNVTVRQHCYAEKQESIPLPKEPGGASILHVELRKLANCR